jgi:hypothetical protein
MGLVRPYPSVHLSEEDPIRNYAFLTSEPDLAICESVGTYVPRDPAATVLYGVVAGKLEAFLARQRERDRLVPRFVERELRAFLDCGVLARGFLRVHCDVCKLDRVVPFSCKGRAFCPSCGGRRMADTAAHLVDHVFPEVPVPDRSPSRSLKPATACGLSIWSWSSRTRFRKDQEEAWLPAPKLSMGSTYGTCV